MFAWLVEHIVSIVPFWVWLTIACAGGIGYFFSGIITLIPFLMPYKELVKIFFIVVCLGGTFMCGSDGVTSVWQEQIKEANARIAAAEAKSKETNIVIQKEYVDRVKTVKEVQLQIQEKIITDTQIIDAECKIAPEAIEDLNAAAMPRGKK
jgi:hypothetical protein